jgi:endogenous inhibitor of DNA gyrase (YacG/DUF329 family)
MKAVVPETFGCNLCGCPSVKLPDPLVDSEPVCCERCGFELGSWREYQERVAQTVAGGAVDGYHAYPSADPARR